MPNGSDKGRLTYAGNSVSFTELDYNNRGFATMSRQTTAGGPGSPYLYDYAGLNRIQWASGYDAAGAPDPSTNLTCAAGASTSAWCHHYSMDAYGNRLIDNRGGLSIPPGEPTAISASTNRATASGSAQWGYDSNGNVMVDGAGNSFTYDAENRQLTGGGAAYKYDGEGRRVTRTQSGGTATFVYDAAGQLAAEYGTAGPASPCGPTCYVTADHLGSTRLVTNQSMTPVERVDYLPYGEEMTFTSGTVQAGAPGYGFYAAGDVRQRFTAKERDAETGLDYFGARYYGSNMGRWTSPDWSAKPYPVPYSKLDNPQTLNLYAYVGNNPLSKSDPDGHYECAGSKAQCASIKSALDTVRKADANLKKGSAARTRLDKVLSFYGAEGQKNGVRVNFADLGGRAFGEAGAGETVAHEGTHGIDQRQVGMASTFWTIYDTEYHAYQSESYVDKGLGVRTESDGDRPVWDPKMSNGQRILNMTRNAYDNTKADCQEGGCR